MPNPRPSVTKRQREQSKRDRKLEKAERRAQRKLAGPADSDIAEPESSLMGEPAESDSTPS